MRMCSHSAVGEVKRHAIDEVLAKQLAEPPVLVHGGQGDAEV